jgi:hypothetical protein
MRVNTVRLAMLLVMSSLLFASRADCHFQPHLARIYTETVSIVTGVVTELTG